MAINLKFDTAGNVELPTMVLALKSGEKLRALGEVQELAFKDSMGNPSELCFKAHKSICPAWHFIRDFRLIWVREWDAWYEMQVDLNEDGRKTKFVIATHLPEAELSQLNLYGVEINTEADIGRDDYQEPTIFFDGTNTGNSLLHRITKGAVNFTFGHIDDSLKHIQRMFSFDKVSIYGAFQEISEEIHCYFEFKSYTDKNGKIVREISAYDLESSCPDCGHRWESGETICPECGSKNVKAGYGKDTTVFLSIDNALDSVTYSTNVDAVKNCFHLEGADDLMTAAIMACNPNGSQYIWHMSPEDKEGMSPELKTKLDAYDAEYSRYYNDYVPNISVSEYNSLISKYKNPPANNSSLSLIPNPIKGHPALMEAYFNTMDMELYLTSGLMPSVGMEGTTAQEQAGNLVNSIKTVAISGAVNPITANNAVLSMAKASIDARYKVEIADGATVSVDNIWSGRFKVTNYSDNEDTYTSINTSIAITDDYETFVMDKITKALAKGDNDGYSVPGLFKKDITTFKYELLKYGLNPLTSLLDCCQGAIDVLIDMGIANKDMYDEYLDLAGQGQLYDKIYAPYLDKLHAIQDEIGVREKELAIVTALKEEIEGIRSGISTALDFEKYIGPELWKEFNAFRRDDNYQNTNYSSDGLDNAGLFRLANEFISAASKELGKSATQQHSVTTSMKNILIMPEFAPIRDKFSIGNFIRVGVDGQVYKLRLLSYELDFNNYENLEVTFSDVVDIKTDAAKIHDVLNNAQSMATSYDAVMRQASKGSESYNVLDNWTSKGLDATVTKIMNNADSQDIVYDSHGILCRRKNDFTGLYDLEQLKIINSTIAMTDNGWVTVKTAVGKFYYYNPMTRQLEEKWGVNGELVCGKLVVGEGLGIYNPDASMRFDKNGLYITNADETNAVAINPNDPSVFRLQHKTNGGMSDVVYFDENGDAVFHGNIQATSLTLVDNLKISAGNIDGLSNVATSGNYNDLADAPDLTVYISKDGVIGTVSDGANGFTVSSAGMLQASNAIIYGTIYTSNGVIGGWNITGTDLYNEGDGIGAGIGKYGNSYAFWAGCAYADRNTSAPFRVGHDGALVATNASIQGNIIATSGTFTNVGINSGRLANFTIEGGFLYNGIGIGAGDNSCGISCGTALGGDDQWIFWAGNGVFRVGIDGKLSTSKIEASGGSIGGFSVYNSKICAGQENANETIVLQMPQENNTYSFAVGGNSHSAYKDCPFRVTKHGVLYCSNLHAANIYTASASTTSLSDERYKTDIKDIPDAEDFIMSLSPKMYKFINGTSDRYHTGFLAQSVKEAMDSTIGDFGLFVRFPADETTTIDGNDPDTYIYGLRYEELISPHIQLTQAHNRKIKELENEIKLLQQIIREIQLAS